MTTRTAATMGLLLGLALSQLMSGCGNPCGNVSVPSGRYNIVSSDWDSAPAVGGIFFLGRQAGTARIEYESVAGIEQEVVFRIGRDTNQNGQAGSAGSAGTTQ